MNWTSIVQALVVTLLGTGGATFLWTAFKAVIAWRNSAEGREDRAIARLEKYEQNCRRELAHEREISMWWCNRAGDLEHLLRMHGIPIPEPRPQPKRS